MNWRRVFLVIMIVNVTLLWVLYQAINRTVDGIGETNWTKRFMNSDDLDGGIGN